MNEITSGHPPRSITHWLSGLIVVAIGLIFLLGNFGFPWPFAWFGNWWVLFILIGALPSLERALHRYRQTRQMDGQVIHALMVALAVITVAVIFLFDLAWNTWWPLFVIYAGMGMLARGGEARVRWRRSG